MTADQAHDVDQAPAPRVFGDTDRAILEFERLVWKHQGAKDTEVLSRFALTPTRYYARLRWILTQPEATAYDAATVSRLQRLAGRRRAVRTVGTTTAGVETVIDVRGVRPMML